MFHSGGDGGGEFLHFGRGGGVVVGNVSGIGIVEDVGRQDDVAAGQHQDKHEIGYDGNRMSKPSRNRMIVPAQDKQGRI